MKGSVRFDKDSHRYYNSDGEEYVSVTRYIEEGKVFDKDEAIKNAQNSRTSIYYGQTSEAIQKQWDEIRDTGTELHAQLQAYIEGTPVNGIPMKHRAAVHHFSKGRFTGELKAEVLLWSHELKIAGTCDIVHTKEIDGVQVSTIYDIKTCTSINKWKREKYSKQLWLYKRLLEEMLRENESDDKELLGAFDIAEEPYLVKVGGIIHYQDYVNQPKSKPLFVTCDNMEAWILRQEEMVSSPA